METRTITGVIHAQKMLRHRQSILSMIYSKLRDLHADCTTDFIEAQLCRVFKSEMQTHRDRLLALWVLLCKGVDIRDIGRDGRTFSEHPGYYVMVDTSKDIKDVAHDLLSTDDDLPEFIRSNLSGFINWEVLEKLMQDNGYEYVLYGDFVLGEYCTYFIDEAIKVLIKNYLALKDAKIKEAEEEA